MEVLYVRIPTATKNLLLAQVQAGRYRNQADAANALIRAGLESLGKHKKPDINKTLEELLRHRGAI
mgnify:FL=1|tara:strand:+ start:1254 stop:1451 length:198 start_codon:yes stop_codon:yes gene_type:complete